MQRGSFSAGWMVRWTACLADRTGTPRELCYSTIVVLIAEDQARADDNEVQLSVSPTRVDSARSGRGTVGTQRAHERPSY